MDPLAEEKIVLDRETFKALAVDTRVNILKELSKRRKTQSEMSESLGLSVATVKEHMDKMQEAGLITQKDEGRKWKYYDLTEKGRCLLHPERKKLWIILVSLFFVAGLALFTTFNDVYLSVGPKDALFGMVEPRGSSDRLYSEAPEGKGASGEPEKTGDSSGIRSLGIQEDSGGSQAGVASVNEAEDSAEDIPERALPDERPPFPDSLEEIDGAGQDSVRFPWLQYISYGMLLFLILLFIYYLSSYNETKQRL